MGFKSFLLVLNVILSVNSIISLRIVPFSFTTPLFDGNAASLQCLAQSSKPVDFNWLKNGINFVEDKPRTVILSSGPVSTLIITSTSIHDVGNYTCVAISGDAKVSHSSTLVLNSKPTFVIEPYDVNLNVGQMQAIFDCIASGNPKPSIKWNINGHECKCCL